MLALAGCSGGGGSSLQSNASATPVSGAATKGPLRNATVESFSVDGSGLPSGGPTNSTTTDANGNFSLSLGPAAHLVRTSGGSFVDEADPAAVKRQIAFGAGEGLEALMPAGATSVAVNPITQALLEKSRRETVGTNFLATFATNRSNFQNAFGFDVVATLPSDPTSPAGSLDQKRYAMVLGGIAQALNAAAVRLGLPQPNNDLIQAVVDDLSDGRLDGDLNGNPILVGAGPATLPGGITFNAEIERFRNNNFDAYAGVPLVAVNESAAAQDGTTNVPPVISDIADTSTSEDTSTAALPFTIADAETAATSLMLSASSDNVALVPNANIVFGGSGGARDVTITPAADQHGSATITVTVSDGVHSSSDSFVLTVTGVNDPPTISDITDLAINEDGSTGPLAFTVNDPDDAAGSLVVSGNSSNPGLIPNNATHISFAGTDANRSITVFPVPNLSGSATITVTVSDGVNNVSDTFTLTVNAAQDAPSVNADCYGGGGSCYVVTINEGGTLVTTAANGVLANDIDLDGEDLDANWIVMSGPANGSLVVFDGETGAFTYTHNGSETLIDSFQYEATDGIDVGMATVIFNITPVNDAPVAGGDKLIELPANDFYTLTSGDLLASDAEGAAANQLVYTVSGSPTSGHFELGGSPSSTFTQADVSAGSVKFVHNGTATGNESVSMQLADPASGVTNFSFTVISYVPGANLLVSHVSTSPVTTSNDPTTAVIAAGAEAQLQNGTRHRLRQMSADGRYTVFTSRANDLIAGQSGGPANGPDVFLFDRDTGQVKLVSHSTAGPTTSCNAGALFPAISADGKYVAFLSSCSNLVTGVTGGSAIWLYDVLNDSFTLVSYAFGSPTAGGNAPSANPSVASTGSNVYVSYQSNATNLVNGQTSTDIAGTLDIFLYDKNSNTNTLVSHTGDGMTPAGGGGAGAISRFPQLSNDGRYVLYGSAADAATITGVTDANGTTFSVNPSPVNGADLYLFDRVSGVNTLINSSTTAGQTSAHGGDGEVMSDDGRYVAFRSFAADLVPGQVDTAVTSEIFLFDRDAAGSKVSMASHVAGAPTTASTTGNSANPSISSNGQYITYQSNATNLVAGFVNANAGNTDVLLYDKASDSTSLVSHSTAGLTTTGNSGSDTPMISGDGSRVTFRSVATNLMGGLIDTNGVSDRYAYDRNTGVVQLISRTGSDFRTTANEEMLTSQALSDDGTQIVWQTVASDLVKGQVDVNTVFDVFMNFMPTSLVSDKDGDGLTDVTEVGLGTNPFVDDTDGDGFDDLFEVNRDGDPTNYNPGGGDSNPLDAGSLPAASSCEAPVSGIVAWYTGDDHADDIQGSNHGALISGATFAGGHVGTTFSFDGVDDYVEVGDDVALTPPNAITVEAWILPTAFGSWQAIASKFDYQGDATWWLGLSDTGQLFFLVYEPSTNKGRNETAIAALTVGVDAHVAATFDVATQDIVLYVDGQPVATSVTDLGAIASLEDTNAPLFIGATTDGPGATEYFRGFIDELAIYDRALLDSEIEDIHFADNFGKCKPTCSTTGDPGDLWEHANFSAAPTSFDSGFIGSSTDMFGNTLNGGAETGSTLFRNNDPAGYVHDVNWSLNAPVTLDSFKLLARHDGNFERAVSHLTLYACSDSGCSSSQVIYDAPVDQNEYDGSDRLAKCLAVEPVTAQHFRAEFTQLLAGHPSNGGPRIGGIL